MNHPGEAVVPGTSRSDDCIGLWTTSFQHPIESLARQRGFPPLGRIPLRPSPASERPFQSRKGVLRLTLRIVTQCPFPGKATLMLDHQQVLIPLARGGHSRGTQHRILARRDDHLGSRSMRLNGGVNRCLIIDTVTDETCNAPFDLGDQRRYVRWVLLMAFRHRRGDDLTLPIRSNVQLFPTFLLLLAVCLGMPFALTTHLSPRTVDDHVNRSLRFPTDESPAFKSGISPEECRMIGTRKSQAHQLQDGAQQPFGLAKRQAQ